MATTERTAQYFDLDPTAIGEDYELLVLETSDLNKRIKALKAQMTAILKDRMVEGQLPAGYEVTGVTWTRWGQHQAIADLIPQRKAKASARPSLSFYNASKDANGENR